MIRFITFYVEVVFHGYLKNNSHLWNLFRLGNLLFSPKDLKMVEVIPLMCTDMILSVQNVGLNWWLRMWHEKIRVIENVSNFILKTIMYALRQKII